MTHDPTLRELLADSISSAIFEGVIGDSHREPLDAWLESLGPAGEQPPEPVIELRLCETRHLVMRENVLYRFSAAPDCASCQALASMGKGSPTT